MTPKLLVPLVFALGTSTAVFAQDTQADTQTDFSLVTIPFDWDEDTADAFFSDRETGELRGEEEISTNWADLSIEQQEIVRDYCAGLNDDGAGLNGATDMAPAEGAEMGADTAPADSGVDLGAPAEPGAADAPESFGETDTAGTAPEMTELCEIVGEL